ncbi:hypothetical protein H4R18_004391 [Coemansia javaensis]|uniref:Uncharacterized protein n=1 Tax=Coemansia javaensis TaxID=2761396 RepID=A0A9W8HAX7_9FUNG|nr:hypothetical protein H4R18_004391 [Coemansia javaensis]
MYEYVRRQQELQPSAFTSKAFQWMSGGGGNSSGSSPREASWARLYARNMAVDPLACSSSSIFAGPPGASRHGTLSILQRSAASLSQHPAVLALRRTRQSSDVVSRPPSGVASAFWPRRRGFTAPPGAQAPLFGTTTPRRAPRIVPSAGEAVQAEPGHAGGDSGHSAGDLDRRGGDSDLRGGAGDSDRSSADRGGGGDVGANHSSADRRDSEAEHPSPPIGAAILPHHAARAGAQPAGRAAAASPSPPPAPQLQSSFSPPVSPRSRTICHRVRELMRRTRTAKQGAPSRPPPRARGGLPLTIASMLCVAGRPSSDGAAQSAPAPGGGSAAATPAPLPPPPRAAPGPRVLPRSPLANAAVLDDDDSDSDAQRGGGQAAGSRPTARSLSSSDEDGQECAVCQRFKGSEWVVQCERGHALCFGCVQHHVRQRLADAAACVAVCPAAACAAAIPAKHLRACLPPHRLQLLAAASHGAPRGASLLRRSLSLCSRWRSSAAAAAANRDDQAFDAPTTATPALQGPAALQKRLSASMPALPPEEPAAASFSPDPLLSELTSVGPGSVDSVVVAAAAAADSAHTLSPESVGSRLRRVPKARDPLATRTWAVDGARASPRPPPGHAPRAHSMAAPAHKRLAPPPPLPTPPPTAFRASATWITPSQRNSGYAEDLLLNATLFETIRRRPFSEDEDSSSASIAAYAYAPSSIGGLPTPAAPAANSNVIASGASVNGDDENDTGVYIPTWRRPPTTRPRASPLWAGAEDLEPQAALISEAAGLSFDLYETLHRRR